MNICYLIRSLKNRGGTENYVYTMARTLAKLGHRTLIVSTTDHGQWDFKGMENKVTLHKLSFSDQAFRGSWRLEEFVPLCNWRYGALIKKSLPSLIKQHSIDIVEATDWAADAHDYLPFREVPVCVRLHGHPSLKEDFEKGLLKRGLKNYLMWCRLRKHLLNADLITGVSKSYIELVKTIWQIGLKDIPIIPIGIDNSLFTPASKPRETHSVLFAGRLEKSKGIEVLAQAIPLVLKEFPNAKFYLAGRDYPSLIKGETWSCHLMKKFGSQTVQYVGALPTQELIPYYHSATVCVMPSLYEPGGTVALEAMFCGCPVVASRVGGIADLVHDGHTGLSVPPSDSKALSMAIIHMLKTPSLRQELSKNALGFVKEKFSLEKIVHDSLEKYRLTIDQFKRKKQCLALVY